MHLANWISFGMMVTHLACTKDKFDCSKIPTRSASPAFCNAFTAIPLKCRSGLFSCTISLTNLWKGSHLIKSSVLVWYFFISHNAFIPLLCFFISCPCITFPFFSPFPFLFPVISLALCAFFFLILSHSAWVCVCFTFCSMSNNRDRFHFSTSIPILRLLVNSWST